MANIIIAAYTCWLLTGMLFAPIVYRYAKKARVWVPWREIWSRVPASGPLILVMIIDIRAMRGSR